MFGNCGGSVWRRDDFSKCFEREYAIPSITTMIGLLLTLNTATSKSLYLS